MKWLAALALCAAASIAGPGAQADVFSIGGEREPPVVSVLTFGQGDSLFEKWGHAALCFAYPHSGHVPVCFNWGVTDFAATADLVWGFLRGEQVFWMEPEEKSVMIAVYEAEDRDIYEQTLALSPAAASGVEAIVLADLDGPWRDYVYDHFFDNCSTRIRDLVDAATGGALRSGDTYPLTFREVAYRGIAEEPLLRGLSDFLVGRAVDDRPTVWQAMFHPDVLRREIAVRLGVIPVAIYKRTGPPFPQRGPSGRLELLLVALGFALPLAIARALRVRDCPIASAGEAGARWRRRFERTALAWATVWLAGWGIALWALVALSGIPAIRYNEVALVLVPFDVVLPFLGAARRRRYARLRVAELLLISALCAIGVLHQPLWIPILSAIIPLALVT